MSASSRRSPLPYVLADARLILELAQLGADPRAKPVERRPHLTGTRFCGVMREEGRTTVAVPETLASS